MSKKQLFIDNSGNLIYEGTHVSFKHKDPNTGNTSTMSGKFSWSCDELRYEIELDREHFPYTVLSYNPDNMTEFSVLDLDKDSEIRYMTISGEDLEDISLEPLEDSIAEYISNQTGFCHHGFEYNINIVATLDTSD